MYRHSSFVSDPERKRWRKVGSMGPVGSANQDWGMDCTSRGRKKWEVSRTSGRGRLEVWGCVLRLVVVRAWASLENLSMGKVCVDGQLEKE